MENLVLAAIGAIDRHFGSSISDTHSVAQNFNQNANDLLFARGLLALVLLFAGVLKLVLPLAVLTEHIPVPSLCVRFMGVAEVLGAMILAPLLRIRLA
jgi:hypothetical protein